MSKAIVIAKNGVSQNLTVDMLRTNAAGGGTIDWVPEDETRCDMLNVAANGTYSAASAGKYGYNVVTVSVPGGQVTGIGTDGNTYVVTKDSSGTLVETKVPSEIRVTTPPTVTTYTDGDTINFTGLVVTAYDDNGQSMGEVPFGELFFPVTQADYSSGEKRIDVNIPDYNDEGTYQVTSIMNGASMSAYAESMLPFPTMMDDSVRWALNVWLAQNSENAIFCVYDTVNPVKPGGSSYGGIRYNAVNVSVGDTINLGDTLMVVSSFSLFYKVESDGTTHFTDYNIDTGSNEKLFVGATEPNPNDTHKPVIVSPFGVTGSGERVNVQTVPVQWPRTGDGMLLETGFDITVKYGTGD